MLQTAGRASVAALVMLFALCRAATAIEPIERAVVEIEAGRTTTPLVRPTESSGEFEVTFLAKRIGRRVPRIVSDLTGWGEHGDGTFDFHPLPLKCPPRSDEWAAKKGPEQGRKVTREYSSLRQQTVRGFPFAHRRVTAC